MVEKLQFVNHTQCECVDKNSMMSGDRPQQPQQQRTPLVRSGVTFKSSASKEVLVAPTPMKWFVESNLRKCCPWFDTIPLCTNVMLVAHGDCVPFLI